MCIGPNGSKDAAKGMPELSQGVSFAGFQHFWT